MTKLPPLSELTKIDGTKIVFDPGKVSAVCVMPPIQGNF
jgi:hypothetical protein